MKRFVLSLALLGFAPWSAWAQEKTEPSPIQVPELKRTDPVVYEKEIETIFGKRCIACHSGKSEDTLKGRFDLGSYEGLIKGGKRGVAVVPGKADGSLLYKMIIREKKPFMPPKGEDPITPNEIALVKLWIDQGAKAPTGPRERPKIAVGTPPANVTPVHAVAVSPDGAFVAAGRGNQIHIYDAKGALVRTLEAPGLKLPDGKEVKAAHLSLVESMVYSPDGKYIVSGSFQEVDIWNPQDGQLVHKIPGFTHAVVALAFSADGKMLAVAGGEPTVEGEVKIFELDTWKPITDIKNGHSDTVYGLSFSPDGKMIATGSADKFVKVWEVPTGKFVKSFEGHTHHVLDVGWMFDGKLIASAGGDNTVKVWDFEKGEQARTIPAHAKQVTRLLFIKGKQEFLTTGGDNQVKQFNASNGNATKTYPGNTDFVYAISASADGKIIAAGGQEGLVRVYNGDNGQLLRTLQPNAPMPPMEKK